MDIQDYDDEIQICTGCGKPVYLVARLVTADNDLVHDDEHWEHFSGMTAPGTCLGEIRPLGWDLVGLTFARNKERP